MTEAEGMRACRTAILERIADAAARVGRDPAGIEVVAVTRTVPSERIRAAYEAGFRHFGENRVQEREAKAEAIRDLGGAGFGYGATWHLVGSLQSNKASRAARSFDVIETMDSLALARRLAAGSAGGVGFSPGRRWLADSCHDAPLPAVFIPRHACGGMIAPRVEAVDRSTPSQCHRWCHRAVSGEDTL